uniref:Uncharacterized protein n=1 Tax=uncultured prokaryote TaxID=198431 RepID=A0A0H5Q6L7_9ZZZZ|nr:hypothetical protein [uncultured prokaryote]
MKGSYEDKNGKERPTTRKSAVGTGYDAPFRGYINLVLTDEQKVKWVAWSATESFWEALAYHVSTGVNLAVKVDPKGTGFLASATQRSQASPNAGLVVTARGSDASVALSRVVYCLVLLGHKERWEDTQPLADPDRW